MVNVQFRIVGEALGLRQTQLHDYNSPPILIAESDRSDKCFTDHRSVNHFCFLGSIGEYLTSLIEKSRMRTGIENTDMRSIIDQITRHSIEQFNSLTAHSIETIRINWREKSRECQWGFSKKMRTVKQTHRRVTETIWPRDSIEDVLRLVETANFTLRQ